MASLGSNNALPFRQSIRSVWLCCQGATTLNSVVYNDSTSSRNKQENDRFVRFCKRRATTPTRQVNKEIRDSASRVKVTMCCYPYGCGNAPLNFVNAHFLCYNLIGSADTQGRMRQPRMAGSREALYSLRNYRSRRR